MSKSCRSGSRLAILRSSVVPSLDDLVNILFADSAVPNRRKWWDFVAGPLWMIILVRNRRDDIDHIFIL